MTGFVAQFALFTVLPVLMGVALVLFDRTTTGPVRRAEAFLVPLFLVGVGGSGLSGFITHVFIADPGSAFQLQFGFAGLALGLLGAVAAERRDGFREATVAAAAVVGAGAALAPFLATSVGLTPTTILQGIVELVRPALLIWLLMALRRAERSEPPTIVLRSWMIPVRRGSVFAVGISATAFAVGNSTGQVMALSTAGIAVAAVVFWWIVSRAASHRVAAASA